MNDPTSQTASQTRCRDEYHDIKQYNLSDSDDDVIVLIGCQAKIDIAPCHFSEPSGLGLGSGLQNWSRQGLPDALFEAHHAKGPRDVCKAPMVRTSKDPTCPAADLPEKRPASPDSRLQATSCRAQQRGHMLPSPTAVRGIAIYLVLWQIPMDFGLAVCLDSKTSSPSAAMQE